MRARQPSSPGAACGRDNRAPCRRDARAPSVARAPDCHLCGRDARAPSVARGGETPAHPASRAYLVITYAGETRVHPGRCAAGATRAPDCHLCGRDNRAPRVPRADDCALSNRGARHAVPLLIRHQNDDMLRPGRNASYRSRSGITPIPASFFPEEEWLVRSCRIFYNLSFCKGSCDFALFPQYPNERHQIE